jgi:hypothetical protein
MNNFDLVILDHRKVDDSLIDLSPLKSFKYILLGKRNSLNFTIFRIVKRCQEKGIPIVMVPHGPQPITKKIKIKKEHVNNYFQPDYFILVKKDEIPLYSDIKPLKGQYYLGDPRFDIDWITYLEKCALKISEHKLEKPKNKIILLYLMDKFTYTLKGNKEYKEILNKDIISLANHFSDLEIWIKHHPRNVYHVPFEKYILSERLENIKEFGNSTDSNVLLSNCDICVSAASTVLIAPILQKKSVVFYDRWKEKLGASSIYDHLSINASSKDELISRINTILYDEFSIDHASLEDFFKKVFSAKFLYEPMVNKYIKLIYKILNIK